MIYVKFIIWKNVVNANLFNSVEDVPLLLTVPMEDGMHQTHNVGRR